MYKNHSYNDREELNQCNKLNRDNTEKLKIQLAKRNKISISIHIYIDITNCRQYCFGLLGLISAVLMSGMKVSL